MSFANKIRTRSRGKLALAALVALAVTVALAGCGSSSSTSGSSTSSSSHAAAVGQAPPEWAANAGAWPAHNHDLANTRATTQTPINSKTVSKLKVKWTFKFPYIGQFGAYTSNPIVLNGVVYIEDPDSNVYALNRETGAVMWKHLYKSVTPSGGPNGLALGYGLLFGATEGSAFALNPSNGKQVWIHKLIGNNKEGIDMAPQLYDGKVLVSTIPGSSSATRRSTAAAVSGTRRRSTATGGSSSPSPIRRRCMEPRSSRTGRVAPVQISTRTRSSPSTARRGSCSGSAR